MSKINGLVAIKHPTGAKMCFLKQWPNVSPHQTPVP